MAFLDQSLLTLAGQQNDWDETNAALGHVALLMLTLAKMKRFEFSQFEIKPNGSGSLLIEKSAQGRSLPLCALVPPLCCSLFFFFFYVGVGLARIKTP